jgi:predicted membrane protein
LKQKNINKKVQCKTEIKTENKKIDLDLFCRDKFFKTINFKDKSKDRDQEQRWNEMKSNKIDCDFEVDESFKQLIVKQNNLNKMRLQ